MMRSISSMSATMPVRSRLVARSHLDAQAQARERRAQVVRDAGQQHGAILLDLPQVAGHRVEAAVDRGDLRGPGLGQRRRQLAAADARDRRRQFAQRPREVAREHVGGDEQQREHDERPGQRPRRDLVGAAAAAARARRSSRACPPR